MGIGEFIMIDWDIMGITVTTDVKVIKRAYASKLKIFHPEENADGFQRLREAYEQALKWASQQTPSENSDLKLQQISQDSKDEKDKEVDIIKKHQQLSTRSRQKDDSNYLDHNEQQKDRIKEFMEEVRLLSKSSIKWDYPQWDKLLQSDIIWNIEGKETVGYLLQAFLKENAVSFDVLLLLNQCFEWEENQEVLFTRFKCDYHCNMEQNKQLFSRVLFRHGKNFEKQQKLKEAVNVYLQLEDELKNSSDMEIECWIAQAMYARATCLEKLGNQLLAIKLYECVMYKYSQYGRLSATLRYPFHGSRRNLILEENCQAIYQVLYIKALYQKVCYLMNKGKYHEAEITLSDFYDNKYDHIACHSNNELKPYLDALQKCQDTAQKKCGSEFYWKLGTVLVLVMFTFVYCIVMLS